MNKIINPELIKKILDHLNKKEFDFALERIQDLSIQFPNDLTLNKLFASTYFKKSDWHNSIKYNKKILVNGKDKYLTYINIGVAYFKLGEINKSIEAYKKSIEDNPNFEMTYNNLAISYIEIGLYEDAFNNFLTDGFLLCLFDKRFDDRKGDICFQQCATNVLESRLNVIVSKTTYAA